METIWAIILGVVGSLVATVIAYFGAQAYYKHKLLQKYNFLKNLAGKWYGLHYTNRGSDQHISLHEYELEIVGRRIKGTRKKFGIIGEPDESDPAIYLVDGRIHKGVLIINEICEETREIGATLINNFA